MPTFKNIHKPGNWEKAKLAQSRFDVLQEIEDSLFDIQFRLDGWDDRPFSDSRPITIEVSEIKEMIKSFDDTDDIDVTSIISKIRECMDVRLNQYRNEIKKLL